VGKKMQETQAFIGGIPWRFDFPLKDDCVTSKDSKASFQSFEKESLHFLKTLDMA